MMYSTCARTSMVCNNSDQSVATKAVGLIRPPPGLDLPAACHPQKEGLASPFTTTLASSMELAFDQNVEANAPVETSIASEKLRSFLEATRDDQYALTLAQQAQWNLAVARVAQQVWYAQQTQSCVQQESGNHATNLAETYHPLRTLAGPGNSNTTSAMQKQSLAHCSEGAPKRPPGVWNNSSRATSCSSGSSTRASSNEDLSSLRSHKLQLDVPRDGFFGCGGKRVCWPVDARKLTSNDIQIVSPAFELYPSSEFKLLIKSAATTRGQRKRAGFKDAGGRGSIELKCVSGSCPEHSLLTFRLSLIDHGGRPQARSSVTHDFRQETLYAPQESQSWDFGAAVSKDSQLFFVCLEIAPVEF